MTELKWSDVPSEAIKLAQASSDVYHFFKALGHAGEDGAAYYRPADRTLIVDTPIFDSWSGTALMAKDAGVVDRVIFDVPDKNELCTLVKQATPLTGIGVRPSTPTPDKPGPALGWFGHAMGIRPNFWTKALGGPNTLTSTLGTGLLGAGLGYGGGWLAEQFMSHDDPRRNKLRKTMGLLGGLGGAALPLWAGYKGWWGTDKQPAAEEPGQIKGGSINLFDPKIDCKKLMSVFITNDRIEPSIKAAAQGILHGSAAIRQSAIVSPFEIVKIASNVGSDIESGTVAGRTLAALSEMSEANLKALNETSVLPALLEKSVRLTLGRAG